MYIVDFFHHLWWMKLSKFFLREFYIVHWIKATSSCLAVSLPYMSRFFADRAKMYSLSFSHTCAYIHIHSYWRILRRCIPLGIPDTRYIRHIRGEFVGDVSSTFLNIYVARNTVGGIPAKRRDVSQREWHFSLSLSSFSSSLCLPLTHSYTDFTTISYLYP